MIPDIFESRTVGRKMVFNGLIVTNIRSNFSKKRTFQISDEQEPKFRSESSIEANQRFQCDGFSTSIWSRNTENSVMLCQSQCLRIDFLFFLLGFSIKATGEMR